MSYKILGLAGSLRRASFNRATLRKAIALAPQTLQFNTFDLSAIPLYNGDIEDSEGMPAPVHEFRQAIHQSDGLLIVTPEYNFSIPGVLKNAIDWASRAYDPKLVGDNAKWPFSPPAQPFRDKPVALMGASLSLMGTVRSQAHLRQSLAGLAAIVMPQPEIFISSAAKKFNAEGDLIDQPTIENLTKFLKAFSDWMARLHKS